MVGPVDVGINRFVLQTVAPNPNLINPNELIGVTVILICCSYLDQKFVQIGYYVNNEYAEEIDPENIPHPLDINKIFRNILADQPRVTRYAIDWSGNTQGSISVLPQDSPLDGLNEQEQEPTDDLVDLDNEVDDDEEEDEEDDDDDDAEVDLEAEDDEVSVDEYDEHGNYHHGMEIMPEDSNSMDVERMVQQ